MGTKVVNFLKVLFNIMTISSNGSSDPFKVIDEGTSLVLNNINSEADNFIRPLIVESHTSHNNFIPTVNHSKVLFLPNLLFNEEMFTIFQITYNLYPMLFDKKNKRIELLDISKVLDIWNVTNRFLRLKTRRFSYLISTVNVKKEEHPMVYMGYVLFESAHPLCAVIKQQLNTYLASKLKYCMLKLTYGLFFKDFNGKIKRFENQYVTEMSNFFNLVNNYYDNFENFVNWLYQKFYSKLDNINRSIDRIDKITTSNIFKVIKNELFPVILSYFETSEEEIYLFNEQSKYLLLYDRLFNFFVFQYLANIELPNFNNTDENLEIQEKLKEYKNRLSEYYSFIMKKLCYIGTIKKYQSQYILLKINEYLSDISSPLGGIDFILKNPKNDNLFIVKPIKLNYLWYTIDFCEKINSLTNITDDYVYLIRLLPKIHRYLFLIFEV